MRCETAIEHAVNLVSVLESCSKTLLSPELCVALGAESEGEKSYLQKCGGIATNHKSESAAAWNIECTAEILRALSDRMTGVALLSEAFSVGGELGMYRDLTRFLELAFGLPFYDKRLAKKLVQFLAQTPCGYSRAEINEWVRLRHPATHADFKKASWLAVTSDVRPVVFRMQQACLDVLFNKARWGDPSNARRNVLVPSAVSTSMSGDLIVKQGTNLALQFRVYDEFGIYPRDIKVKVDHSKDGLYATFVGIQKVSRFRVEASCDD